VAFEVGSRLAGLERRVERLTRASRLASASIEGTAVQVYDEAGSLRAVLGVQSDGTTAANIVNGPPPPAPSDPVVTSVLGGIIVTWDGTFAAGAVMPLDWQRVEVHASIAPVYEPVPATLQTTIETAQGATVVVSCDAPVYVRLVARNTSGAASTASATVGPFGPTPVVADDILDGIVTTLKLADDAVTEAKIAAAAVGTTALQDGAVLEEKLAANAVTTAKLADQVITETKLADDAVTAAKVAVGAIGADQLALGIGNLAPDPSFEGAYTAALITGHADWTVVTPGNNSAKALHVDCTAGGTTWKNIELARYPILPGERHYLGIDFKTSATYNGSGVKLMFRYEDATATVLGYGVADKTFTPGAGWDRATAQVQAPTGTKTAVLLVEASACSAGEAWFDNAEVSTLVVGGKVAAGSITAAEIAALTIQAGNLAADSVAAGKVAADAITAREIAAASVTASEIAANAVTAAAIAAGTVTADKLTVVGGSNVLNDPSFEGAYAASVAAKFPAWAAQDLAFGNGSAASMKITTDGTSVWRAVELALLPTTAGDQLYIAVDYYAATTWTGSELNMHVRWETEGGTILATDKTNTRATSPVKGAWTRLAGTYTAPATAVRARIRIETGLVTAGNTWFDNAVCRPVVPGTQIQDGVITTPKLAALAVTAANIAADAVAAGKIAADAVTAREIQASSVTADELAANSVVAGKIAAGAVTATSLTVGIAQSIAEKLNDAMADSSMWSQVSGTGNATWLTNVADASAGSTVMQANSYCTMERQVNIPYDPDALYRITVRLRVTTAPTANGQIALGLSGIAADGTTRVNTTGANSTSTQHFVAASGVTISAGTTWTTYTGYIKGTAATGTGTACPDPKAPGQAHTNVRYVRPLIRLLLNSTDGVAQVDQVTVETVPTGVVNNVNIADGAITANKISAGSVDATALAADAITGKTITGGTITGAVVQTAASGQRITLNEAAANKVLVYNSGGTAIGELSATGLLVKGTGGAVLWLDPNNAYPNLRLTNAAGTNSAIVNVSEPVSGNANLGMNSGTFSGSGWTDVKWRTYQGADFWVAERIRDSDATTNVGGRVFLDSTHAVVGYQSTVDSTQNATLSVQQGLATLAGARMVITPPASSNSGLLVSPASGHTGYLTRVQLDGADRFLVDKDGNTTVTGSLTVNGVGNRQTKRRTTDLTRANTVTPANDTQITFTVDANAVYVIDGYIKYSGTNDVLVGFTSPSGSNGEWQGLGNGIEVVSGTNTNATQQNAISTWGYTVRTESTDITATRTYGGITTTPFGIQIHGLLRVGSTAGTFALQWAQGTSGATVTTLYTDSYIRIEKVA